MIACLKVPSYITEVESVNSGLDEKGEVWGQMGLDLHFLIVGLIIQLQKEQSDEGRFNGIKLHLLL